MIKIIKITLTTLGASTGPLFDLVDFLSGIILASDVTKTELINGYYLTIDSSVTSRIIVRSKGQCTNEITLTIPCVPPEIVADCGTSVTPSAGGGLGYYYYRIVNVTGVGNITLTYDAIDVPDQFTVTWNGVEQFTTGFVSNCYPSSCSTYNAQLNALGFPNVSGPNGSMSFYKPTVSPSDVYVTILAPLEATGWGFILSCSGT